MNSHKLTPIQTVFALAASYSPPPEIEQVKIEWPKSTWLQKRRQELYLRECGKVSVVFGDYPLDNERS